MKARYQLPEVILSVAGMPLEAQQVRALEEVRVSLRLSQPAQCELVFRDPPGPLEPVGRLTPGVKLQVSLRGETTPLFTGEVTAVETIYEPSRGQAILVRGYDLLHRLRKRQPVRAHLQETLPDLATALVADLGITVQSEPVPLQWQRIIQHRQSDLEVLVETAARCGIFLALRQDTLHLFTLSGEGEPLKLTLGDTLYEARFEVNSDPSARTVTAQGWDPLHVVPHSGSANQPNSGRSAPAEAAPDHFSETGQRTLSDELAADDRHAQALAQAELDVRIAREVILRGAAEGSPALMPGAIIEVEGVAPALLGRYVLTAVTHTLNERLGFVSELSSEPPALPLRSRSSIVALGVVVSVDDPEAIGRVKVRLPTYNDVETEWMGVLCAAAGPQKGLIMLPEVGDTVLVLFARQDPAEGIILGGLYGAGGPPDSGVVDHAVRRYTLLTSGGQKVVLDDVLSSIHLEDKTGSSLDLSPKEVRLHAVVDLEIEAPGKAVTIRGKSIDFETG